MCNSQLYLCRVTYNNLIYIGLFVQVPLEASQGDEVEMEVPLSSHPSPVIEWFYDEKPIESTDKIAISQDTENTKATIPKVEPEDSGTYKCIVSSLKGTTTKSFLLNVEGIQLHKIEFRFYFISILFKIIICQ